MLKRVGMLVGLFCWLSVAQAKRIAVFPIEDTNLDEKSAQDLAAALATATADGGATVDIPARIGALLIYRLSITPDAIARALGNEEYITSSAIWHDDHLHVHAQRRRADGQLVGRATVSRKAGEDLGALARDVVGELTAGDVPVVLEDVERSWIAPPKKRNTKVGFALEGFIKPPLSNDLDYYPWSVSFMLTREFGRHLVAGRAGIVFAESLFTEVSVSHLLTEGRVRPYAGGGLRADFGFKETALAPFIDVGVTWQPRHFWELALAARLGAQARRRNDDLDGLDRALYSGIVLSSLW